MDNTCKNCTKKFEITDKDLAFYEKITVPPPKLCPLCREQRRITFRNEKNLYLRHCALCKKQMVSIYSPDKPYKVLCAPCWWSDKWDQLKNGRDFDFNRTFMEQFDELIRDSHLITLFGTRNQNSEYVNQETDDKNCYMNAGGHYNEDCYYNTYSLWGKNNVDNYWIIRSELCYECINCENCFNSTYLQDCQNCTDCNYCKECVGCQNCFGSFGLRHKKNYFFNKPLPKSTPPKALEQAKKHFLKFPHRANKNINCEECTGDYLLECKNVEEAYLFEKSRDVKYGYIGLEVKDSMDLSSFGWGEALYNVASSIELNNVIAASSTINLNYSQYCFVCFNSSDLFGCTALNRKKHCIFNKQYSPAEYEKLKEKIITHMKKTGEYGEFFPPQISPFCYNETVAYEYFPLTKDEVLKKGWKWKDPDKREYQPPTKEILACEKCKKNYKIIEQEAKFYKKQSLEVPKLCPDCRHCARIAQRNPHRLHNRHCDKCETKIQTTYSPDRPEIIYCEKCYQTAII